MILKLLEGILVYCQENRRQQEYIKGKNLKRQCSVSSEVYIVSNKHLSVNQ